MLTVRFFSLERYSERHARSRGFLNTPASPPDRLEIETNRTERVQPVRLSFLGFVVRLSTTFPRQNPGERSIFILTRRATRWKSPPARCRLFSRTIKSPERFEDDDDRLIFTPTITVDW